jgi:hypothetical protein
MAARGCHSRESAFCIDGGNSSVPKSDKVPRFRGGNGFLERSAEMCIDHLGHLKH